MLTEGKIRKGGQNAAVSQVAVRPPAPAPVKHVPRAAVVTDDGYRILLSLYQRGRAAHPYELTPLDALCLAEDLISIAARRLRRARQERSSRDDHQ